MACAGCARNKRSMRGFNALLSRAPRSVQTATSSNVKTVNSTVRNANKIKNISAPKITKKGYVVTCLICQTESKPTPVPDTVVLNCNCSQGT